MQNEPNWVKAGAGTAFGTGCGCVLFCIALGIGGLIFLSVMLNSCGK